MRDPRDAYERDVDNSTSGFGKDSYAYQQDGGANDENHALDQQPTWYIRLNGKLIRDKQGNPYSFQDKAAANKAALNMQAKLFNKDKEFMLTTNPNDKVAEGLVGAALGGLAGAALTKSPGGAMTGASIGSNIQDTLSEELQADDGEYYDSADDFFGQFEAESFDNEEQSEDGMEIRGYIDGVNVMVWRYEDESMTGGYGYYDDSALDSEQGLAEEINKTTYAEELAEKLFDDMPNLQNQDDIIRAGYVMAKKDSRLVGRVDGIFRDEDFPSDFVSVYRYIQHNHGIRNGVEEGHTEVKDKEGKVVSWKDDSEWHPAEKNKQGQPKDPRGVVTHMSDVARRKTASQQGVAEAEVDSDGHSMDHADSGEYDYEGDQAKDQLNTIVRAARRLNGMLDDNENMPEWVQMKITNAADYIDTAADYIESNQAPELDEGDKIGNMDADKFDTSMARLKQLAGAGPMKTVYDPTKRVYKNVPTAVQPKK
jgi:hypothetical protein